MSVADNATGTQRGHLLKILGVTFGVAVSLGEHALANAISSGGLTHSQADPYLALTVRGHLSLVLLLGGSLFLSGWLTGAKRAYAPPS